MSDIEWHCSKIAMTQKENYSVMNNTRSASDVDALRGSVEEGGSRVSPAPARHDRTQSVAQGRRESAA